MIEGFSVIAKNITLVLIFAFVFWVLLYVGSAFLPLINFSHASFPVLSLEGLLVGTLIGLFVLLIRRRQERSKEPPGKEE